MNLTINEILMSTRALSQLSNAKVPIGCALTLANNLRALNRVNEIYEKRRQELCEEYGTKSKDGMQYQIPNEKIPEFNAAIKEITDEEVTIELQQVQITDLGPNIEVSPNDLVHLKWLFSDLNDLEPHDEVPDDATGDSA